MAENVYEGMFILDTGHYGREPDVVSDRVRKMIEEVGGEVLVSRLWEERRLAYPIRGHRKGTYWLTYARLDGKKLVDIQRQCQLTNSILRALFVKVDPRIVDTLVEHAQAGPVRSARAGADRHTPKLPKASDLPKASEQPKATEPPKGSEQPKEQEGAVAGEGTADPPASGDVKD